MRSLLLGRPSVLLGWLFTGLLFFLRINPAAATHLEGGELRYRFVDFDFTNPTRPARYEITFSIYTNCEANSQVPNGRGVIGLEIYDRSTGLQILDPDNPSGVQVADPQGTAQPGTFPLFPIALPIITPTPPPGCSITAGCIRLVQYSAIINLPIAPAGYYGVYSDRARNATVVNLDNPLNQGQYLYVLIPSPILSNRSPIFSDTVSALLCAGSDTTTLINNAFDPDGDLLTYRFIAPYDRSDAPGGTFDINSVVPVDYAFGFSQTQPFGASGYAFINPITGETRYSVPNPGDYVVAIQVDEHRTFNGRDSVISSTLREIQLKVRQCPTTTNPVLQFNTAGGVTNITIDEGQTTQFTATASVSIVGNPVRLSVTSPLLDGPGGFNATFNNQQGTGAGQPIVVNGITIQSGTFQFVSTCGSAGVYNVNLTARDEQGCPVKETSIPYVITVRRPIPPTRISGDTTVCPNSTASYTAVGAPASTTTYQWTVTGGTIQGAATGATVTVRWTAAGTGTLSVKAVSSFGCPSPELLRTVEVSSGVNATLSGLNPAYCVDPAAVGTPLTASPAGGTFTITGTGGTTNLVNGVFTPRVAGTFVITYSVTDGNGCVGSSPGITVVVNPLPTIAIAPGLPATVCSNDLPFALSGTVNGAIVSTGFTIDGQPATVFNPAVLSAGPHVVALLGTGVGGCTATATRTITINAAPTVLLTGLQTSYCKNAPAVPLTATANGTPITGANAVFEIDGAAATQLNPANLSVGFHIVGVRGTGTNGCRDTDSVRVEIKALPVLAITSLNPAYCRDAAPVTLTGTVDAVAGGTFTIDGTPATSFNPGTLSVGLHTVVFSGTGTNSCSTTTTQTVRVNPLPVVRIVAPTANSFCLNEPAVTLTGNAAGQFFIDAGTTAVTSFLPAALGVGQHVIRFTRTEASTGCSNDTTLTITIRPLPVLAITGLQNAYCADAPPVTLTGTVDNVAGGTFTIDGTAATVLNPATLTPGTHTIIFSGTGVNGCATKDTASVTINALPTVAITGLNAAYCQGDPAVTLAATVNSSTGNGTVTFTVNGTTTTTFDPTTLAPGTYTVIATGTLTATGCQNTTTRTITINALPTVAITGLNPAYCVSATAVPLTSTLTGGTGSVTYTVNGSPATTLNPAILGPGTYTVIATGTVTSTGCRNTATQTVTINALPTVTILGLNPAYCQGSPAVTLGGTVSGNGAISFTVNGTATSVFDPSTLTPGTYTVIATGTDTNTCSASVTQTVVINALPTVAITGLNPAYCASSPAVTLAATVSGGGTSTFTVDGQPATVLDPATLTAGTHTVVATGVVTSTTCENTATQTVTINALPTVAITGLNAVYCQGEPAVALTGTVNGSSTGVTFTVNGTPQTSFDPSTLAPGGYTIIATGTDNNTCVNTTTQTVTINPKPTGDQITGPPSVCPGLTAVPYAAVGLNFQNYRWRVVGGTINGANTGSTINVDWGPANANAKVQLVSIADPTGCASDTVTLAVRINQVLATQTPVGAASFCVNAGPQTFSIPTPSPGSSYSWALTGTSVGTITGNGASTVTVTFTQPGTASLVVTETSSTPLANCFGTSAALNVNVLAAPDATLAVAGPSASCADGSNQTFTLPGATGSTYQWTVDGAVQTATTGTFDYPATTAGTFTIGAQETNAAGCVGPVITTSLTVNAIPQTAAIGGSQFICPQGLTGQSYTISGGLPGSTFQWNVVGGTITAGQGTNTVTIDFDGTTTPSITATETSSAGCAGPAGVIALTLDQSAPDLNLATVDPANPVQNNLVLGATNAQPNTQLVVQRRELTGTSFSTLTTLPGSTTTYTDASASPNTTAYVYRVDLTNGCGTVLQSAEQNTMLLTATAQEASGDVVLTWNEYSGRNVSDYRIQRSVNGGAFTDLATVTGVTGQISYTAPRVGRDAFDQTFRVLAGASGGAAAFSYSNEAKVQFANTVRTYNIITPDGDGKNDFFVIDNATLYPDNELAVFNRWGREVYRRKNYDNTWNGDDLGAGTYYYQFTANGQTFKSWVEIVK
jgi:gliding motility-associated-like protein